MNSTDNINPKLLKIVALAKQGVGGERETAIKLVKKICTEQNIDFGEVMNWSGLKKYEPRIAIKTKSELQIIIQIASKYCTSKEHHDIRGGYYHSRRFVWVEYWATPGLHIEVLNACRVYLEAYRKERKQLLSDMNMAFVHKHKLWPAYSSENDTAPTEEEIALGRRAQKLGESMQESVNLNKELDAGLSRARKGKNGKCREA